MNVYLLRANLFTPSQYPDGAYEHITMNQLWDFQNPHKVFDLYDDPFLEDSLIIINRDHLQDLTGHLQEAIIDGIPATNLNTRPENLEVLAKIRNCKNKRIIVIYNYRNFLSSEIDITNYDIGDIPDKIVLLDKLGFEPKNIMYITQTKSDTKIIQKLFDNNINATYFDRWLDDLFRHQIQHCFTKKKSYLEKNPNVQDKLFSLMIRRYENSRVEVMCELISKNLLQDFYYTFAAQGGHHLMEEKKLQIFDYINNDLPSRYLPYKNKILEWATGIPYEAKLNECSQYGDSYEMLFTTRLNDFYNHSKINIVLETDFHSLHPQRTYGCIITEKTYKAMLYKKPFILLSQPNALAILKNCGYRTFNPLIDESYDTLPTVEERLRVVSDELIRIGNLDSQSLEHLLASCQENVEHNYKLLLSEADRRLPKEFNMRNVFGNK